MLRNLWCISLLRCPHDILSIASTFVLVSQLLAYARASFGANSDVCPCYYSLFRPQNVCATQVCGIGYQSSCYAQCRRRRRKRTSYLGEDVTLLSPVEFRYPRNESSTAFHIANLANFPLPSTCNNRQLEAVLREAMVLYDGTNTVETKLRILNQGAPFLGTMPNVICGNAEDLSYVTCATDYCWLTAKDLACYAFSSTSRGAQTIVVR